MITFFGSSGGTPIYNTAPTAGYPTFQVGTGLFSGGAAPNFQGTSAIGVNMASGYAGNLLDLQIAGVSKFSISQFGVLTATSNIVTSGNVQAPVYASSGGSGFTSGFQVPAVFTAPGAANSVLVARGSASQTADIFQVQDSGSTNQFAVANVGSGAAPIWALKVTPVANTASMAQSHVAGAATNKAIQVVDNTGATIGWINLTA